MGSFFITIRSRYLCVFIGIAINLHHYRDSQIDSI